MKEVIEGYCCHSMFFGVTLHKEKKEWVSISDDIFVPKMFKFKDKKVRIIIEELE